MMETWPGSRIRHKDIMRDDDMRDDDSQERWHQEHSQEWASEEEEAITKQKSWQPQIKKIVKYFCLSCLIYSPEPGSVEEWWINRDEKWN